MKIIKALLAALFPLLLSAQNNDCVRAEQLCFPVESFSYNNGAGSDDFADPDNNAGCILNRFNENWFFITFNQSGIFELNIQNSLPNTDPFDLDFAVFDGSNGCGDLGSPIRCSEARSLAIGGWRSDNDETLAGNQGAASATGMSINATDNPEPITILNPSHGFTSTFSVNNGETYYILVTTKLFTNVPNQIEITWNLDASSCTPLALIDMSIQIQQFNSGAEITWNPSAYRYEVYKNQEFFAEVFDEKVVDPESLKGDYYHVNGFDHDGHHIASDGIVNYFGNTRAYIFGGMLYNPNSEQLWVYDNLGRLLLMTKAETLDVGQIGHPVVIRFGDGQTIRYHK